MSDQATPATPEISADGWPVELAALPVFDASENASDIARTLYDSLERVCREWRADGKVSTAALEHADLSMAAARGTV